MKSKLIKIFSLLCILVFSTGCIELAKIVPNYYAKEMCSCLFVMEQDRNYCDESIKQDPPPQKIKVNYKDKTVKAIFYIFKEKAIWVSDEEGCQIK